MINAHRSSILGSLGNILISYSPFRDLMPPISTANYVRILFCSLAGCGLRLAALIGGTRKTGMPAKPEAKQSPSPH